jgi:hypothetical protein
MVVFWVVTPCDLIVRCQSFGETHCFQELSPADGDNMFIRNVVIYEGESINKANLSIASTQLF